MQVEYLSLQSIKKMLNKFEIFNGRISKALSRKGLKNFALKHLRAIPCNSMVLAVGAGGQAGAISKFSANKYGFSLFELDIDNNRLPDVVGDLCLLPIATHSLDAVIALEVLEHVRNPIAACSEIARVLKPNGVIILSTPFIFPIHDNPYDYYRYTKYGLKDLLDKNFELTIQEKAGWAYTCLVLESRVARSTRSWDSLIGFLHSLTIILRLPFCVFFDRFISFSDLTFGYFVFGRRR